MSGSGGWSADGGGPGPGVGGGSGRRTMWLAALAGVATALLLVLVLRSATDPGSGSGDSAADPSTTVPTSASTSSGSSTTRSDGSDDGSDSGTPVTVDEPRADQEEVPDLAPPGQTLDTAPEPVAPITDPQEAATAYLIAADSVTADDAGLRHRRAEPYLAPENPEAQTGVLVADPPPAGSSRTIEILSVSRWSGNEAGDRIAFEISYQPNLSPSIPAGDQISPEGPPRLVYVVVVRQTDGSWLVAQRAATLDPVE